jgi:hypothetical protein
MIIGAVVAAAALAASDSRRPVLAVARDLAAGHQLASADVVVVQVAADPGVALVGADQLQQIIGRLLAVPVRTGSLLSMSQIGTPVVPGAGNALVATKVDAGQFPPALKAGDHVSILLEPPATLGNSQQTQPDAGTGGSPTGDGGDAPVPERLDDAVVVSVLPTDAPPGTGAGTVGGQSAPGGSGDDPVTGGAVVTLLLPDLGAMRVAAAPGVRLIAVPGSGR